MSSNILLITYLILIAVAIYYLPIFKIHNIGKTWIIGLFILKFGTGLVLTSIYTSHYTNRSTADIFKYYDDGNTLYSSIHESPALFLKTLTGINDNTPEAKVKYSKMNHWYRQWENATPNDNHAIIRVNAFIRIFSMGNYHIHTLFLCFLAFIGVILLYKGIIQIIKNTSSLLFIVFAITPTILIWSSGNLKETILLFGLGLFIYSATRIFIDNKTKWHNITFTILAILILISIKSYVLFILLFLLAAYLHNAYHQVKKPIFTYFGLIALAICGILAVGYIFPQYNFLQIIAFKQRDFYGLAHQQNSGSILYCPTITNSGLSIIHAIPFALFNVIFQPITINLSEPLKLLATLENLYLLIFPILAIIFFNKANYHQYKNEIILCFSFVLLLYLLIGLTTPIAGAIVRYKMPAIFFYLTGFIAITDWGKLVFKC